MNFKTSKLFLIFIISLYLIGFVSTILITDLNIIDLFTNINPEKFLFLISNIFILICFVIVLSKNFKSDTTKRKFYTSIFIIYVLLQFSYLVSRIYNLISLNLASSDLKILIGNQLINPNGFIPNVTILMLFFYTYLMINKSE